MINGSENKISSTIAFLIVFLFILPTGYFVWKSWDKTIQTIDASANISINSPQIISKKEKAQINDWINKNNLNQYGDPKNTIYSGGSPLFNESTGKTLDLYSYILEKYPNKPWRK